MCGFHPSIIVNDNQQVQFFCDPAIARKYLPGEVGRMIAPGAALSCIVR
jgi:hypothetical protein